MKCGKMWIDTMSVPVQSGAWHAISPFEVIAGQDAVSRPVATPTLVPRTSTAPPGP